VDQSKGNVLPPHHDLSANVVFSESTNASPAVEDVIFPAHEPIRPVFCCTSVKTKDSEYAYKLGSTTSTLQRGRMCIFRNYIAEYSQDNGIPVSEDLHWPEGADYLIKVVQYRQAEASQSLPPKKKRKVSTTKKIKRLRHRDHPNDEGLVEWEQAAPGRYFVETEHKKGKRRLCHAFEEILVTENLGGIPACFERVEEITMEVMCPVHSEKKWICEFWRKVAGD
jgi:hypothetical protein